MAGSVTAGTALSDFIDISSFVWLLAVVLSAGWAAIGYWIGRKRAPKQSNISAAEFEALKDQNWSMRDESAARRKAEAASEAKSRFLATMAHEIRTPLNGILGLADLLKGTKISREQKSYVDAIRQSSVALNALVHEILDFSRIEAGHLNLNPELMSLTGLTESVVELLAPKAQEKGLEIATFVSSKLPERVVIDAARVRQVLLNLAGNAVKFTPKGGVGISAELVDHTNVKFSVFDTGPGIAEAERGRIFNEFDTGDTHVMRAEAGAGLGLAISQRLVTHMGGSLNLADSAVGAQFVFTIPFTLDPVAGGERPADLPRQRILVVARTTFEAPFIARRLQEGGNEVVLVENHSAAVKHLVKGNVDTVIIDCAIGETEAAQISASAHSVGVERSLILFSPYERGDFSTKIGTQFDGWLVKPVRAQSLLTQLWPQTMVQPAHAALLVAEKPKLAAFHALLAEDDDINALVGRKILESLGAKVTLVRDGAAALDALNHQPAAGFDLCVFDIRMPKVSGLSLAKSIRQNERSNSGAPLLLIAASANSLDSDRAEALEAGFDFYLHKPLAVAGLNDILQSHFKTTRRAA